MPRVYIFGDFWSLLDDCPRLLQWIAVAFELGNGTSQSTRANKLCTLVNQMVIVYAAIGGRQTNFQTTTTTTTTSEQRRQMACGE